MNNDDTKNTLKVNMNKVKHYSIETNYNFNRLESNSFLKIMINSSTVQFLKEAGKELGSNDCCL